MSRSAGPGSPGWFMCAKERQWRSDWHAVPSRARPVKPQHKVKLTGRTKPYKPKRGSCIGLRSTFVSREYRCSCGHVGWSNHKDLEQMG